jgi:hypothetical protein
MDRDTQEEWRRKETQIECRRQQAEFVVLISCIEGGGMIFGTGVTSTVPLRTRFAGLEWKRELSEKR